MLRLRYVDLVQYPYLVMAAAMRGSNLLGKNQTLQSLSAQTRFKIKLIKIFRVTTIMEIEVL